MPSDTTLVDVKKRMVDHVNAAGIPINLEDSRLWLYNMKNEKDPNSDNKIEKRISLI